MCRRQKKLLINSYTSCGSKDIGASTRDHVHFLSLSFSLCVSLCCSTKRIHNQLQRKQLNHLHEINIPFSSESSVLEWREEEEKKKQIRRIEQVKQKLINSMDIDLP